MGSYNQLERSMCHKNRAVYLDSQNNTVFVSSDFLQSSVYPLRIPTACIQGSTSVTSVTFTESDIVLSVNGQIFIYKWNDGTFYRSSGSTSAVDTVVARQCCSNKEWCHILNTIVVAYSSSGSSHIFVSYNKGFSFERVNVGEGNVYGATVLSSYTSIAILMQKTNGKMEFHHVTYGNSTVNPKPLSFSYSGMKKPLLSYLKSSTGNILLTDGTAMLFSPNGGITVSEINIDAFVSNNSISYKQLLSNEFGEFVAASENGELVYGREGFVTLAAKVLDDLSSSAVLAFADREGILFILEPQYAENGSVSFQSTEISLTNSIESVSSQISQCKCQTLWTNMKNEYALDKREHISFTAKIIPYPWESPNLIVTLSDPHVLPVVSLHESKYTNMAGVTSRLIDVKLDERRATTANYHHGIQAIGVSHIRLNTEPNSLRCSHNMQRVSHVAVGCPQGKHIKIRNTEMKCTELESNYQYEIPAHRYDPTFKQGTLGTPNEPLFVNYTFEKLGCPIKIHYKDLFRPQIDLYIGNTLLGPMLAEFVMYEVHGMYDYKYNSTVFQAGCVRHAQTWLEMVLNQTGDLDPSIAWTKNNYRSCFVKENGSTPQESDHYEVLTNSKQTNITNSSVSWPEENGIYVFEVIVVDPDFTFCDLRTTFAVQVYGMSYQAVVPQFIVSLTFMVVCISIVIASYFIIKVNRKKKAIKLFQIKKMIENQEVDMLAFD